MKLLIADDEVQIREGLAEGIDWPRLKIDEVLTAANGLEAYELCRRAHPEIVITDIRMPGIDGLQLSRQIMELYRPVRIIVLSGYSEFSYAQQSVRIGVEDYLLKPIDISELEEKVTQCVAAVEKEKSESTLRQAYTLHNRRTALRDALKIAQPLEEDALEMLAAHAHLQKTETCFIAEIAVDDAPEERLEQILAFVAARLTAWEGARGTQLFSEKNSLTMIFPAFSYADTVEKLQKWQTALNAELAVQFSTSVSIALSDTGTLRLAAFQLEQAHLTLNHRIYRGAESFLCWDDVKELSGYGDFLPFPAEQMEEGARMLNAAWVDRLLAEYAAQLRSRGLTRTDPMQAALWEMQRVMLSALREKGFSEETIGAEAKASPQFVTVDAFEAYSREWCRKLFERVRMLEGLSCSREIMCAADYILSHYTEDISLDDVAGYIGKSRNYFSALFKREMGVSFVDFIAQVRVREACRLLQTTNEMTYEIARNVGFGDYKYFSKVFKKITGHSPSHYRKHSDS